MKIGIIGTGAIGSILAEKLSNAGHQVKVANTSNIEELTKTATSLGAIPATLRDVVKDVNVIIVAIPLKAYKHPPQNLLQEPGTPAYCSELNAAELKQALASAKKGKAPAIRDYIMDKISSSKTMPSEALLALNRSAHAGHVK